MVTDYGTWFCILTIFVSKSSCFTNGTYWKKLKYTGPVTLNYYSLIQTSSVISCIARCWPLYNWDQIYFQGEDCYCLAPIYAKAGEISGTMTANSSIWTMYQDTNYCSEKGYTIFPDQGYCLKFFTNTGTWEYGESRCREDGGHLGSLYTGQDLTNARSLFTDGYKIYIGAHMTLAGTKFVLITGETVNESLWETGEPDNYHRNEECAALHNTWQKIHDYPCTYNFSFMCQILLR